MTFVHSGDLFGYSFYRKRHTDKYRVFTQSYLDPNPKPNHNPNVNSDTKIKPNLNPSLTSLLEEGVFKRCTFV